MERMIASAFAALLIKRNYRVVFADLGEGGYASIRYLDIKPRVLANELFVKYHTPILYTVGHYKSSYIIANTNKV